jgi:trans-2,3-dihydro-3-hydroxyanthranilate isomerase
MKDHRRAYAFCVVDVFAEQRFGGNPLAVFPEAVGLTDDELQAVARELNFAETTFALPPETPGDPVRVRIFTPRVELPFAGHPTIGTATVLASRGYGRPTDGGTRLILQEGIGAVDVVVQASALGFRATLSLDGRVELPVERPDAADFARCLSLPPDAIVETWFAAVGPRFAFARLSSRERVDAAVLDRGAWQVAFARAWGPHLYFFAGDTSRSGAFYVRMFAPGLGVDEDAATGSGAASLVASLAARKGLLEREIRVHITQGVALGRPSVIEAVGETSGGQVRAIRVAGNCIPVADGTMYLG